MHLPWREVAPGDGPAILTSVTDAEAAELARLAAGQTVLEIGSAYGYSAVVMARAGAEVTAVDPHEWIPGSFEVMLSNLAAYGVAGRVEVVRETSQRAMPWLEAEGLQFGLVFVDGDHAADAARHDIRAALRLVAPGGALAVHDVGETCCCPDVGTVAGELLEGEMTDTMLVVRP